MTHSEPSLGCPSGARCCRAAEHTPYGALGFGGRRLPTTCETVTCRCSSPSFRGESTIAIQLVHALGLAMLADFVVVFST
jgi:hypothetical protein